MKRILIASGISLALFGCGNASSTGGGGEISIRHQSIQGGQSDLEDVNVVGMVLQTNGGIAMCSGNLIAPNLVLTARHCVSQLPTETVDCGVTQFSSPYPASDMYFSTDAQISYNSNWIQGAEVHVPDQSTEVCGYDVALVVLSQNFDVTPLIPRIDLEPQTGEPYTAVGYGETGSSGWNSMSGTRMELGNLSVSCGAGVCPGYYGVASSEFLGDTGVCSGDSGGPALDANGKVIGVVSRGGQNCSSPIYGAVSAWRDLIMQVAVDAATKGGYPTPFWALSGSSDPSPGTGGAGGSTGTGGEPNPGVGGSSGSTSTGAQGQACNASASCPTGFQCLSDDGTNGNCYANCSSSSDCGAGLTCDPTANACMAQASPKANGTSDSSGGCSIGASGRGPVKPVPWVFGMALLALGAGRRRRR
jgi:MYXO-CTERM domain-containing protein